LKKKLLRWVQFTPQNDCLRHDQGQHSPAISTLSLSPLVGEFPFHQRFTEQTFAISPEIVRQIKTAASVGRMRPVEERTELLFCYRMRRAIICQDVPFQKSRPRT
jgi:hypothetical protein